jgi:hypothetical protein
VSDTHGNTERLRAACERFAADGISIVLHGGDIKSEAVIEELVGYEAYFVLGNVDRDEQSLRGAVRAHFAPDRIQRIQRLELAGKQIALTHGHTDDLNELIASGTYDYVIHGHTHIRRDERHGPTRVLNPGALGGMKKQSRSYAILTPGEDHLEWVELS